jgi:hypothetical protein
MNVRVKTNHLKNPDNPKHPWEATCVCPWTEKALKTFGDSKSGALYAMGMALKAEQVKQEDTSQLCLEIACCPDCATLN